MTISITIADTSVEDFEAAGDELTRPYRMTVFVESPAGTRDLAVSGWHLCGWLARGASADLDGSGLDLWGDSQPGGWSVCDGDGAVSGRPAVRYEAGSHRDPLPSIAIESGEGGDDYRLHPADLGLAWPADDGADDEQYDDLVAAAEAAMQQAAEALRAAIDGAIPDAPDAPDAADVFADLSALPGWGEDCPVRFGRYLGCAGCERVAIRTFSGHLDYAPSDDWEDAAAAAMGRAIVAAVNAAAGQGADDDDDC